MDGREGGAGFKKLTGPIKSVGSVSDIPDRFGRKPIQTS